MIDPMSPSNNSSGACPRIVRDVAKLRKKEIAIEMAGQNTDLDKSVLDALADPLAHLVRKTPPITASKHRKTAWRTESQPAGQSIWNAYHHGNQVVIEISDNGRGISHEKLVRKAIQAALCRKKMPGSCPTMKF